MKITICLCFFFFFWFFSALYSRIGDGFLSIFVYFFRITVSFNVNHTVDSETEPEINIQDDKPDIGEMKSKPNFEVDIKRGNQTLGFSCSFNTEPGSSGASDEYSTFNDKTFITQKQHFIKPKKKKL